MITTVSVHLEGLAVEPIRQLVNTHGHRSGSSLQNPLHQHLLTPRQEDGKLWIKIRRRSRTQGVQLGAE